MVFMLLNRPTRLSHHITLWNCFICWLFSYIYFIVLLLLLLPPPPPPLVHLFIRFDCIEKMHGLFYVNKWNIPAGECCLSSHHIKSNHKAVPSSTFYSYWNCSFDVSPFGNSFSVYLIRLTSGIRMRTENLLCHFTIWLTHR